MEQNTLQVDGLITFINAFLAGELVTLPEIHRAECEALASIVGTSSEQRAGTLQNIRNVPKYKAFDELLKRRFDPPPDAPIERPYQLHPLSHYKNRPRKEWAVDGVVFDRGSSLFAGPGGSGKSAFVLDMCLSRVCGMPFLGRNVKPAFLIWVAAESLDELFPRAQAWLLCHKRAADEPLDMLVLEERMPLNDPAETEKFILSINAQLAEVNVTPNTHSLLIVFDTYSKCTPGSDENNTKSLFGNLVVHCNSTE